MSALSFLLLCTLVKSFELKGKSLQETLGEANPIELSMFVRAGIDIEGLWGLQLSPLIAVVVIGTVSLLAAIGHRITRRHKHVQEIVPAGRPAEAIRLQSVLLNLIRNSGSGTEDQRLRDITETLARALGVARAGIWTFNCDHSELSCIDLYQSKENLHEAGLRLRVEHYRSYFAALEDSLVLATADTHSDPRTSELWQEYLEPLGISSMLDVPIRSQTQQIGVICLEHIGRAREWTSEEQSFASAVADQVSLFFAARERGRAEEALRQSEELHRITLESISDAVFITTSSGELTYIAPNVHYTFGYTYEEARAIGNISKLLGPAVFAPADLEQAGEFTNLEREIVDKEGRFHSLLINVKRVSIGIGSILYTCRDISERKEAERLVGERAQLAELDAEVSICMANTSDLGQSLRRALAAIAAHIELTSVHVWLIDESGQNLDLEGSVGPETHLIPRHERLRIGSSILGQVAALRKPQRTESFRLERDAIDHAWAGDESIAAFAGQPLVVDHRAIGVLATFSRHPLSTAAFYQLGNIAAHIAMGIDRKRAELAMQQSEQKYRDLVETSNDLIWSVDAQGRWTFVNQAARSIYGYEPTEMLGKRWMDTVCSDFAPNDRNAFEELNAGETRITYQTAHCRKDGSQVFLLVNAMVRTDEQGKRIGATGTATNITDRKKSEEALRESDERVQLALTGADLGLWDWNIDTGVVAHNERGARMLEFRLDEVEPTVQFWRDLIHPADRFRVMRLAMTHLHNKTPLFEAEFRLRCKTGAWRWILCRGKILRRDPGGRPLRAAGTNLDISERKRVDDALREANELLESKVAERTSELEAANDRLTELDRLKSEFLATMSHELRTPLNSIIGFVGILLMGLPGPLNAEQRKQLQMVKSSATLLLGLINDLLDLSRIESGKIELYRQRFSLQDVIDEVCKSLIPQIEQKHLDLVREFPSDAVQIHSDRKRVYQILLNLLNNAVKFTEHGSIGIALHATEDFVSVAIKDTGIGIRTENIGLLFAAFRQIDGSARRNYEGSGLGLHLCRKLLDLLRGDISVESELGRGSKFTIYLPRQAKETPKEAHA